MNKTNHGLAEKSKKTQNGAGIKIAAACIIGGMALTGIIISSINHVSLRKTRDELTNALRVATEAKNATAELPNLASIQTMEATIRKAQEAITELSQTKVVQGLTTRIDKLDKALGVLGGNVQRNAQDIYDHQILLFPNKDRPEECILHKLDDDVKDLEEDIKEILDRLDNLEGEDEAAKESESD